MMKSLSLVALALCLSPLSVNAEETQFFKQLSFSLVNGNTLATPDNTSLNSDFFPQIALGIGFEQQLSDNWQWQSAVSVEYSHAHSQLQQGDNTQVNAGISNSGLWVSNTLKRVNLIDDVSPFITLEVGRVKSDVQTQTNNQQQWQTGYRALAGLEFNLDNDMSLSVAVGNSHFD
ncbi:hypothetical protein [Neptunicella marina]|uniref:Outer membrane protein beta-barrel domain-containing protein n=1 Tax=Neptunicella marina TaxID=2125989 RepID=A0A8J6IM30_9ALTE|nr:hypothetical protein [Neptunicella marina]MBC3764860.1 hypothetical protein [Neptunicella marina]